MQRGHFCMRLAKKCLAAPGRADTGAEASGARWEGGMAGEKRKEGQP
jgi:hypothetical protein